MVRFEPEGFHRTILRAFSTPISWTKVSASCRYRFEILGLTEFQPEFRITAHTHDHCEVGLGLAGTGKLETGKDEAFYLKAVYSWSNRVLRTDYLLLSTVLFTLSLSV